MKIIRSKDKKIALKVLEVYKKEHRKHWFDFMKGMLLGYMHDRPTYTESSVIDFEEWLNEECTP